MLCDFLTQHTNFSNKARLAGELYAQDGGTFTAGARSNHYWHFDLIFAGYVGMNVAGFCYGMETALRDHVDFDAAADCLGSGESVLFS